MAWAAWIRAGAVAEGMAMAGPERMDLLRLDNGRKKEREDDMWVSPNECLTGHKQ